jgi:hypothetical protein
VIDGTKGRRSVGDALAGEDAFPPGSPSEDRRRSGADVLT